jgi:hypothetical protein
MKIKLDKTPEQVELIKAAGSKNKEVSAKAMEILAGFISTLMQQVINRAAVATNLYDKITYAEDSYPSIPLDIWLDKPADTVRVWSQSIAGGLPTSHVQGLQELKFVPFTLDSAVSMLKKYARLGQLENVARAIEKMTQEILSKKEVAAFTPILAAAAQASTTVNGNALSHIIASNAGGIFQLADLNALLVRVKKINSAWDGGTPAVSNRGVTDLFLSYQRMADVRSFAYQPVNTRSGAVATSGATSIALPDSIRESIYNAAGTSEIFGVALHEVNELDAASPFTAIFDNYYGGTFAAGAELILGIDSSRPSMIQASEIGANESEASVMVDDQFVARQEKIGWYTAVQNSYLIVDDRALCGITVAAS